MEDVLAIADAISQDAKSKCPHLDANVFSTLFLAGATGLKGMQKVPCGHINYASIKAALNAIEDCPSIESAKAVARQGALILAIVQVNHAIEKRREIRLGESGRDLNRDLDFLERINRRDLYEQSCADIADVSDLRAHYSISDYSEFKFSHDNKRVFEELKSLYNVSAPQSAGLVPPSEALCQQQQQQQLRPNPLEKGSVPNSPINISAEHLTGNNLLHSPTGDNLSGLTTYPPAPPQQESFRPDSPRQDTPHSLSRILDEIGSHEPLHRNDDISNSHQQEIPIDDRVSGDVLPITSIQNSKCSNQNTQHEHENSVNSENAADPEIALNEHGVSKPLSGNLVDDHHQSIQPLSDHSEVAHSSPLSGSSAGGSGINHSDDCHHEQNSANGAPTIEHSNSVHVESEGSEFIPASAESSISINSSDKTPKNTLRVRRRNYKKLLEENWVELVHNNVGFKATKHKKNPHLGISPNVANYHGTSPVDKQDDSDSDGEKQDFPIILYHKGSSEPKPSAVSPETDPQLPVMPRSHSPDELFVSSSIHNEEFATFPAFLPSSTPSSPSPDGSLSILDGIPAVGPIDANMSIDEDIRIARQVGEGEYRSYLLSSAGSGEVVQEPSEISILDEANSILVPIEDMPESMNSQSLDQPAPFHSHQTKEAIINEDKDCGSNIQCNEAAISAECEDNVQPVQPVEPVQPVQPLQSAVNYDDAGTEYEIEFEGMEIDDNASDKEGENRAVDSHVKEPDQNGKSDKVEDEDKSEVITIGPKTQYRISYILQQCHIQKNDGQHLDPLEVVTKLNEIVREEGDTGIDLSLLIKTLSCEFDIHPIIAFEVFSKVCGITVGPADEDDSRGTARIVPTIIPLKSQDTFENIQKDNKRFIELSEY